LRTLISIITIVIILLGGSWVSYRYIESGTRTMGGLLESVEDSITVQNWEEAQAELQIAQEKWKKDNTLWSIVLDHFQIDNIDINMKRLEKYIGLKDMSLALGEVTSLKLHFEHIFDTELFTLRNIF